MKTIRVRKLCKILFAALLLPAIGQVAYSATVVWTNTAGGNWSVAANWNPNQVPGTADTANITDAGTYTVILDVSANVNNLAIGGGSGVQTLKGTGFTLVATNATVNSGGVLGLTNSTFSGALTIASGGLFNDSGETVDAQVTVESGGEFLVNGSTTLGGNVGSSNEWLWVQSGGLMNSGSSAPITLYVQMTNAGTLNFTNEGITSLYNPGSSPNYDGGLVNQSGGIINLISTAEISGSGGFDYVLNQGTINVTNGNSTINVDSMMNQGTVATLPGTGTLTIGNFNGLGTLTGTYNAAAGTIIKFVSNDNPGTSPGAGLTLGGSGQYEFTAGLLTLPNNVIPGLQMTDGTLLLGAGFQGGAVTNLTLNGMSLTNNLPVTGTLVATNGALYGTITVSNGAALSVNGVTVDAQVTVESGGEFLVNGSTTLGGNVGSSNEWLWVQSGGLMNSGSSAPITLYVQMTNAGTLNFTNEGITSLYNPGSSPNYDGGLVNQSGGIINLISTADLSGSGGSDYVLNQGTINVTNGNSTINVDNFTNLATLNAGLWTLQLQGTHLSLQPSGTLDVALASATVYGKFSITGAADLTGALVVALDNGYIPTVASSFSVLSYSSYSGGFTSFSLPDVLPKDVWQPIYSNTALTLAIQPPMALLPSGTNVVLNINGTAGHQAIELTGTNLAEPLTNWTPVTTNTIDVTTYLGVTNNVNLNDARQFFIFQLK